MVALRVACSRTSTEKARKKQRATRRRALSRSGSAPQRECGRRVAGLPNQDTSRRPIYRIRLPLVARLPDQAAPGFRTAR